LTLTHSPWLPYAEAYPGEGRTVAGDVRVLRGVEGNGLAARDILVYLPPSYESEPDRRYPVLYMHDGQNVFDASTSYAGEWGADEAAEELAGRGLQAIIVAVPNGGDARMDEYGPWPGLLHHHSGGGKAEEYLRYLLDTVRPAVDGAWRTLADREHTGIAGSSMGGLISLYAALTQPQVFGYCAALSPSLWWAHGRILTLARGRRGPKPRVYLDTGLIEGHSHALRLRKLRDRLEKAGYEVAHVEDETGDHSEGAWRRRFPAALEWFLDPAARPGEPAAAPVFAASMARGFVPRLSKLFRRKPRLKPPRRRL
jgi:predicted alpha/beta superfamily hydrolase